MPLGTGVLAFSLALLLCQAGGLSPASILKCHKPDGQFDFIVVGGGSGGNVVAGRLAEAGAQVLVLEAGPTSQTALGGKDWFPDTNLTVFDVPLEWQRIVSDEPWKDRYEWNYSEESGAQLQLGRVLGGCGAHNALLYVRGTPRDFDSWPPGWQWRDVIKYYKRSEWNHDFVDAMHNGSGPLSISLPGFKMWPGPTHHRLLQALQLQKVTRVTDMNGAEVVNTGRNGDKGKGVAGSFQFLVNRGIRDGSAASFLTLPVKGRLVVLTEAQATRLVIENGTAVAVEFSCGAEHFEVRAAREIIVAAGAVNSPKLLLLSGIGPRDQLEKLGLPVHSDLPVGEGLKDAVGALMAWHYKDNASSFERCNLPVPPNASEWCQKQFSLFKQPKTRETSAFATAGISAGAFLLSPSSLQADIQATVWPYAKPAVKAAGAAVEKRNVATLELANLRPNSSGYVRLNSTDPFAPPVISAGYLADPADAKPLLWAVREARRMLADVFEEELLPGPQRQSDEEILSFIRCGARSDTQCDRSNLAVQHLIGSCAIGSVVDSQLRVNGVKSLRVADASVLPDLPSGNCHASVLMVGERAAEFILNETHEAETIVV